jgi:D-3-phosphoglycerate dehydrogenase
VPYARKKASAGVKVLVADKFEKSGIDGLKAAGCDVIYQPDLKDDALTAAIRDAGADVLVVRSTEVTAPMLEAGSLSLVCAPALAITRSTSRRRRSVASTCRIAPGRNAIAVAELAFALLLSLDRRVPDNVAELRAGTWNKKEYQKARGLFGRTLGLLGYGNIGQEMARRAHAFGMPIVVWSRRFATGKESRRRADSDAARAIAGRVAERSDVLSVHLALNAETRGSSTRRPRQAEAGSYFINTARGEVVDYAALEKAVRERDIRVGSTCSRPSRRRRPATSAIRSRAAERLRHASHRRVDRSGAGSDRRRDGRIISSYKDTGKVPNVVNLAKKTPATHMLVVRHRDRPGVLAHVFEHLAQERDQRAGNRERHLRRSAGRGGARINLDGAPADALLKQISDGNSDILDLHLVTI